VAGIQGDNGDRTVGDELAEVLGLVLGLREQPSVLDRDGGFGGEQLEQAEVVRSGLPVGISEWTVAIVPTSRVPIRSGAAITE